MSVAFDPRDIKSKPILDYFATKKCLIIDPVSVTRGSIKKTLGFLGADSINMYDVDNYDKGKMLLESKNPDFIIANYNIEGGSVYNLYQEHLKICPNRLSAAFIVIAEPQAVAEVGIVFEYEMDGVITLPMTGASVIETLVKIARSKVEATPYLKSIAEARAHIIKNELNEALDSIEMATTLSKNSYEASFYSGEVHGLRKDFEIATAFYDEAIRLNSGCFRSLSRLRSLYSAQKNFKKAYEINSLMVQKFPTPPNKIPELIRLSVINEQYEDIADYYDIFKKMSDTVLQSQIQSNVSAGLAVLGREYLKQQKKDLGLLALADSFKLSNGKYEILKMILDILEVHKNTKYLYDLFEKIDVDIWPSNAQAVYFYSYHLFSADDSQVYGYGEKLLRAKIKDVLIYKGVIERSISMKRPLGAIETLVLEGTNTFPEQRQMFEKLLENAKRTN